MKLTKLEITKKINLLYAEIEQLKNMDHNNYSMINHYVHVKTDRIIELKNLLWV